MRVKVCGMTQHDQVLELAGMGVSFAGFIFYARSPRYVLRHMSPEQIRRIHSINKVGVFVNASVEGVLQTVDECRLQMVQLHGDESPKTCERIANYVSVIKAFRLGEHDSLEWMTAPYRDACDMYMFDTFGAGYGGTGKKFDWNILRGRRFGKPYFLSGGIEPGDEDALLAFRQDAAGKELFAVDINSRFETSPGIKELQKIATFVARLNQTA